MWTNDTHDMKDTRARKELPLLQIILEGVLTCKRAREIYAFGHGTVLRGLENTN